MATILDVFDFALLRDDYYEAYPPNRRKTNEAESGKLFQQVKGDRLVFRVPSASVGFPQPPSISKTYANLVTFVDEHKALAFLFMPLRFIHRFDSTIYVGDGVEVDFTFKHLFLQISSVEVFLDDVKQTSGFTLFDGAAPASGDTTSTDPFIRFDTAPAGGVVVRIEALFYNQVVFMNTPLDDGDWLGDDNDLQSDPPSSVAIQMQELVPGGRFNPQFTNPTGI